MLFTTLGSSQILESYHTLSLHKTGMSEHNIYNTLKIVSQGYWAIWRDSGHSSRALVVNKSPSAGSRTFHIQKALWKAILYILVNTD